MVVVCNVVLQCSDSLDFLAILIWDSWAKALLPIFVLECNGTFWSLRIRLWMLIPSLKSWPSLPEKGIASCKFPFASKYVFEKLVFLQWSTSNWNNVLVTFPRRSVPSTDIFRSASRIDLLSVDISPPFFLLMLKNLSLSWQLHAGNTEAFSPFLLCNPNMCRFCPGYSSKEDEKQIF